MKNTKTIWVLLRSHAVSLPPVMTVIQCLLALDKYQVKFISTKETGLLHPKFNEYIVTQEHNVSKLHKIKNYINYRNFVNKNINEHSKNEDLFWLASLDTALSCKGLGFLSNSSYILHLHELYDTHPRKLKSIKSIARNAKCVVVPEENRAGILQIWLQLKKRPVVLPNKPFNHPRVRSLKPSTSETKLALSKVDLTKKIVIYQGHIGKDRHLEPIIKAIDNIENVEFWLMGIDHGYVEDLLQLSKKVKYLGYIPSPYHLEITSYADIGILSYDLINLNNLYCAPNKIWEYLGFDIYFICNNVSSLSDFAEQGCCSVLDFDNISLITKILEDRLKSNLDLSKVYNSINLEDIIFGILSEC